MILYYENSARIRPTNVCHLSAIGLTLASYGQIETCYNLDYLYWDQVASSTALGKDLSSCWVYTQSDCAGQFTEVDSNLAKFQNSPSGVASFQWFVYTRLFLSYKGLRVVYLPSSHPLKQISRYEVLAEELILML